LTHIHIYTYVRFAALVVCLITLSTCSASTNLIVNGNFEAGNTGFDTSYTYLNPGEGVLHPDRLYTIVSSPENAQPDGFIDFPDHTPELGVYMLVANGANTSGITLWQTEEEITVATNTVYTFSYWLLNVHHTGYQPPIIQTYINGILQGEFSKTYENDPTHGPNDQWFQAVYTWYSEAATTVTIRLVDESLAYAGNDFAIDDISFTAVNIYVSIDIKPGSDPNPINPGSNGLVPVAILTTDGFDAVSVDAGTVTLAGASVAVRGKSEKLMSRLEDVDGDGDDDLLLQVEMQSEGALWESGPVTLRGETYDGTAIEGTDDVIIVP